MINVPSVEFDEIKRIFEKYKHTDITVTSIYEFEEELSKFLELPVIVMPPGYGHGTLIRVIDIKFNTIRRYMYPFDKVK